MHITSGATGIESQGGRAARNRAAWCVLLVWLAMVWGCATPSGREQTTLPECVSPKLARPLSLLDAGRYTDAMIEAQNPAGEELGESGLLRLAGELDVTQPQQLADELLAKLSAWRGGKPAEDDQTLVVMHHNASDPPKLPSGSTSTHV